MNGPDAAQIHIFNMSVKTIAFPVIVWAHALSHCSGMAQHYVTH